MKEAVKFLAMDTASRRTTVGEWIKDTEATLSSRTVRDNVDAFWDAFWMEFSKIM